uniref:dolichyl-diphosphooligosaccharide--protein glycotransferase n=1 Tax=Brassica campestris TaxID=3711 RepID=M4F048_BRACM
MTRPKSSTSPSRLCLLTVNKHHNEAGLVDAALIAICPGYISRSVAGSYDNEAVAIFALLLTFYLFVKAVNTGSLSWALGSAFGYFYMVSSWGGYVFIINLVFYFLDWMKYQLNDIKLFQTFLRINVTSAILVGGIALGVGTTSGYISPWTRRFYSLLDPLMQRITFPLLPLFLSISLRHDATIFIVMYGLTSLYFAGVMIRLILVATPAICLISAIAVSATVKHLTSLLRAEQKVPQTGSSKGPGSSKASSKVTLDPSQPFQRNGAIALLVGVFYLLTARGAHGNRIIFDDYCEAYYWLRQNTPTDAKVMSWWDYGYQITAMGNITVIVDNNTWNNTHIATVGRAMSSYEDEAYDIMRSLDVNYVLVVFGGVTGYSSDDINKFLWMVRIGGGVDPVIKEPDYLVNGELRVDKGASPKMLNCLMYKLCYYRFGELVTEYGSQPENSLNFLKGLGLEDPDQRPLPQCLEDRFGRRICASSGSHDLLHLGGVKADSAELHEDMRTVKKARNCSFTS